MSENKFPEIPIDEFVAIHANPKLVLNNLRLRTNTFRVNVKKLPKKAKEVKAELLQELRLVTQGLEKADRMLQHGGNRNHAHATAAIWRAEKFLEQLENGLKMVHEKLKRLENT